MKHKWDERYAQAEYAYGENPNLYLKEQLQKIPPGTILFPAEGEGRNAVYAAKQGWKVFAFDQSIEGRKKAIKLAAKNNVNIQYSVGEFESVIYDQNKFDCIVLIYAHFAADKKSVYHKKLTSYLRSGGFIILEAFSKTHLKYTGSNEKVGGPRELEMLYSIEEIKSDFNDFEFLQLEEKEIELNEGLYHIGKGSVIRFTGRKK